MDRGTFVAASGGLHSARQVQVISHNLANVNTVGYKAQRVVSREQEFQDTLVSKLPDVNARAPLDHDRTPGITDVQTVIDFTPGPISPTGNPLDVALNEKNQFFVVQTPAGERLTRAGNFRLNAAGALVTPDGMPVVGSSGPITVTGTSASISANGSVVVDGAVVGQLRVVEIEDLKQLKAEGLTRFDAGGAGTQDIAGASIAPASLEMSNISVVDAMVQMLSAQKSFEAYAKSIGTIDELNSQAIRFVRSV